MSAQPPYREHQLICVVLEEKDGCEHVLLASEKVLDEAFERLRLPTNVDI